MKIRLALRLLVFLATALVAGDFMYSRITQYRLARWEAGQSRDTDGVLSMGRAFSVGQGSTALLLVHGFIDSPALWRRMAPKLAEAGFHCRAMRLPGFAEPMERYGERYGRPDLNEWRSALRREVERLRGTYERVWMVGHSMGGALAIDYLAENPEGADGLVLVAPLVGVSGKRSPVLSPRGWYRLGDALFHFSTIMESVFPLDARDPEVRRDYPRNPFVPRRHYGELFKLVDAVRDDAENLILPILVLLSENDQVIDPAQARAFFERCPSRRKKIVYVNHAGHVIPWDYGWEEAADRIATFVSR